MKLAYEKDCKGLMEDYNRTIKSIDINCLDPTNELERGISICKTYIQHLLEKVFKGCIQTKEDEIHFFKHIKPVIAGDCLFFFYLRHIVSVRSQCDFHEEKAYLLKKLNKSTRYLKKNLTLNAYYKNGKTNHDEDYFIRCNLKLEGYNNHPYSMMDSDFATSKDYLFAEFRAHERLIQYLEEQIIHLDLKKKKRIQAFKELLTKSSLNWTANQVDFTELIYALKTSKSVNHGKVNTKELAAILCAVFNLSKFDVYRVFVSIKNRQKEKTVFLNYLKDCLEIKIEEDEWK